jgi:hypothetical protein
MHLHHLPRHENPFLNLYLDPTLAAFVSPDNFPKPATRSPQVPSFGSVEACLRRLTPQTKVGTSLVSDVFSKAAVRALSSLSTLQKITSAVNFSKPTPKAQTNKALLTIDV